DAVLARALPRHRRGAGDRMRRMRIGVWISPRPVLSGDGELELDPLEVRLEVPVGDRPVGADAVARTDLEVRRVKARRVTGEVRHRAADALPRVVLAHLDRIAAADEPFVRPVERMRSRLVAYLVAVGISAGPLLGRDHPPA